MLNSNPLQKFYRKSKFTIALPSRGKWYPKNSLKSTDGSIEIFAMSAADETRFKTNEVLISPTATYDLIRSCAAQITDPESMPTVDLDAVILSIRRASYGNQMNFTVPVPNTALTHTINLDIEKMVSSLPNILEIWDDELTIKDDGVEIVLNLAPLPLRSLYATTKQLFKQQRIAEKISNNDSSDDEKIEEMDQQLKTLSSINVGVVADSIKKITCGDYHTDKPNEIKQFVNQIDLAYFQAIRKHIEEQKAKSAFAKIPCEATEEQLAAGAPLTWHADIEFNLTNFFAQ
jgi:hypothetical protein